MHSHIAWRLSRGWFRYAKDHRYRYDEILNAAPLHCITDVIMLSDPVIRRDGQRDCDARGAFALTLFSERLVRCTTAD